MVLVLVKPKTPRFELGRLVATRGVVERMRTDIDFADFVRDSLNKHMWGDWGDLSASDKEANEIAADLGDRLLSAYNGREGLPPLWVITEADRSATTILFPEEY